MKRELVGTYAGTDKYPPVPAQVPTRQGSPRKSTMTPTCRGVNTRCPLRQPLASSAVNNVGLI